MTHPAGGGGGGSRERGYPAAVYMFTDAHTHTQKMHAVALISTSLGHYGRAADLPDQIFNFTQVHDH